MYTEYTKWTEAIKYGVYDMNKFYKITDFIINV